MRISIQKHRGTLGMRLAATDYKRLAQRIMIWCVFPAVLLVYGAAIAADEPTPGGSDMEEHLQTLREGGYGAFDKIIFSPKSGKIPVDL
jgi:ABC-type cobalt transport system substrate-binding protein